MPIKIERQPPLFNLDQISQLFDDDTTEIIATINSFIELTPLYADAILAAWEQNNMEEVAEAAHKLKSSLELLATENLRTNINLIHDYAKGKHNLEKLPALMKYFGENIPLMIDQLKEKEKELRQNQ